MSPSSFFILTSALLCAAVIARSADAVNCNVGGYDLSQIPTAQLTINQQYGSQPLTPYMWVINVCQMVNLPPGTASSCTDSSGNPLAGYISEYSSASCETTWNQLVSTSSGANSVTLNFAQQGGANHPGWTATIQLSCGFGPVALSSTGNVVLTGASTSALNFAFSLTTSAVCGVAPSPTPGPPAPTPGPAATPVPGAPTPPVLPIFFQGLFTEYTAYQDKTGPPYVNGVPPAPLVASRGRVYYDWTLRNMIEVREDYCVNIFPEGHDFPCVFQNVNDTSYLITFNRSQFLPACCIFGKPWSPPQPAFLRQNVTAEFYSSSAWDAGYANWFKVPDIAPPTGPFFYSFNASVPENEAQVYSSFAFPGISGWVQQQFYDISFTQPDSSVWDLPDICLPVETLPTCDFFGSHSASSNSG